MMRPFIWWEIGAITRTGAFAAALAVHVLVLGTFLLVWGGGMPVLPGDTVFDQLLLVQGGLLSVLLPWTASRCGTAERGNDLVMLAAATATPPSRMALAQAAGRCAALALVVGAGLPMVVVAQQASAVPFVRIVSGLVPALGLCAVAGVAAGWAALAISGRIGEWLAATGVVVGLCWVAPPTSGAAMWIFAALAVMGAAFLAARADDRLRFLSEEPLS